MDCPLSGQSIILIDADVNRVCQRSSVVEQRFRKPSVVSSTLTAGSKFIRPGTLIVIQWHFVNKLLMNKAMVPSYIWFPFLSFRLFFDSVLFYILFPPWLSPLPDSGPRFDIW
jgi:hypothetical protein